MDEQTNQYLIQMLPQQATWVHDMEDQAAEDHVPIMDPISMHFVTQLISLHKPDRILEIGTAIGYSALRMHEAYPVSNIITIERDDTRFRQAVCNIEKQNKQQHIRVIHGDALDELDHLAESEEQFDVIFIDAAKGQYQRFFELAEPLLKESGLMISDNVLFKGLVADPDKEKSRLNKIAEKIGGYNAWLTSHPDYTTSIVPVGDGIAISMKKAKERSER